MLLINGMPVIHIELKKSGVSVSQACHQIEKYSGEGAFTGLFSLVQIFVAMEPKETVYFANPGPEGVFNRDFYFHWADFNNEPINSWQAIASSLLSIPMAHQLIGFYIVADDSDGVLKVMRSYQYYAANAISDRVAKLDWKDHNGRGGYIWHTTGSGKTMTSFKSAQLIADSKDADKVIFLMDRIELGTQSLREYRNFASENESVQATENTGILEDLAERGKFAKLFRELNLRLESARIQGFAWNQQRYVFELTPGGSPIIVDMHLDENEYLILALRYKELYAAGGQGGSGGADEVPYEIDGYLTQIDTGRIDSVYMNSRFDKYLKLLRHPEVDEAQVQRTLDDVHKSFAYLSQDEQKYANLFLHDVQGGYAVIMPDKSFRDYVTEYQYKAKNDQIHTVAVNLGLDEALLRALMNANVSDANINEYNRFSELKATVDRAKARAFFQHREGRTISPFETNKKIHSFLKDPITGRGGYS
jgi:hypothetical protein